MKTIAIRRAILGPLLKYFATLLSQGKSYLPFRKIIEKSCGRAYRALPNLAFNLDFVFFYFLPKRYPVDAQ